jgi:hypothetical protein
LAAPPDAEQQACHASRRADAITVTGETNAASVVSGAAVNGQYGSGTVS